MQWNRWYWQVLRCKGRRDRQSIQGGTQVHLGWGTKMGQWSPQLCKPKSGNCAQLKQRMTDCFQTQFGMLCPHFFSSDHPLCVWLISQNPQESERKTPQLVLNQQTITGMAEKFPATAKNCQDHSTQLDPSVYVSIAGTYTPEISKLTASPL